MFARTRVRKAMFCSAVLSMLAAAPVFAQAEGEPEPIDWFSLGLECLGGLALFLYGVSILATALRALEGGRFQRLLLKSSSNRFSGLATGTAATVALDSSSVTIVLLIAIVDAGLLSFANALPVILGANIGTTFSSQIFAWNVDEYAPVLIAGGLIWKAFAKSDNAKNYTTILIGIGIVLFGLHTIGNATEPLQEYPEILEWLRRLENPLLGVLAGAVVTVAIQSSSAMMGIVITMAGGGLISLPAGLAIMLGAEIGTCADTLIASVGRSRAAVKAALFHLVFNIVCVTIGVLLIQQLAAFALSTSSDTGQQIANAHVLFNVAGALLFLPIVGIVARLLDQLVPARDGDKESPPAADAVPRPAE